MSRYLKAAVLAGLLVFSPWAARAQGNALSPEDIRVAKGVFTAIDAEKWKSALRQAEKITNPLLVKAIKWFDYTRQGNRATFAQIAAFMADNPRWPLQKRLQIRAEEAMTEDMSPNVVLSWFETRRPLTADGGIRLGAALLAKGREEEARAVLRRTWIEENFGKHQEEDFFRRYRKMLSKDAHVRRLDRLLWEGRYWASRRMLWRVKPDYRAVAEARLLLRHNRGDVDRAIARVPDSLKNDPGLVYERLRWRRRKGRDLSARELLKDPIDDLGRPEMWARERSILARRALQMGHISEAYRIAKDHGLDSGPRFADAEWLAGWIALRFLRDYEIAADHFVTMFDAVRYPLSRSRAAYWMARSQEALLGYRAAKSWYETAARYPTTYYGQLAAARLKPGGRFVLPPEPKPDAAQVTVFEADELVQVVRLLGEVGAIDHIRPFILALAAFEDSPGWRALTAYLSREQGRPDLAIRVTKRNNRAGRGLVRAAYPTPDFKPLVKGNGKPLVEIPLVLSIIRQESGFFADAHSPAGARGLMQLLPNTAYKTARRFKLRYSRHRLVSDPDFNVTLGQAHLAELLDTFDGSYVLALTAYNAGPSRVRQWLRTNGDPRDKTVDVIDWIELIPFDETRNYVQRVFENLQMYRLRLGKTQVALTLENDLRR